MALLARYDFTGSVLTATTADAGVDATELKGNGTAGKVAVVTIGSYPDQPILQVLPSGGPAFGHRQLTDSFDLSVAPGDGGSMTLTTLTFKVARGGSSTSRGFEVTTSADGHGVALLSVPSVPTQRSTFTTYSVDLSPLGTITSPLTLRWYYATGSSSASLDFDDFEVSGTVTASAVSYLLNHSWAGVTGATFTSDAKYAHLAGTKPTIIRASFSKGLRFDGSVQGVVEHVYAPAPGAGVINHDRIYVLGAPVTETSEVWQGRVGAARGPGYAFTADNRLRLLKVTGVNGVSSGTTTATLPVGVPFRVAVTTNGATVTVKLYADDTTGISIETLTTTTSDDVALTAVRDGVITATGLGSGVRLDAFYPQDSRTVVPGPRTYVLAVEGPQVSAVKPAAVEPWQEGVTLAGSTVQETYPIASQVWAPAAGNPVVLDAGTGPVRTFTSPASLDAASLVFDFTATDTQGLTGSTSVTVPVLPATHAVWQGGQMVPLDMQAWTVDSEIGEAPAPTPQIVVRDLVALTTGTDLQQWEFRTNDGVPVTRRVRWRKDGSSSYLPSAPSSVTRTGPDLHTATAGPGLEPGTYIPEIALESAGYTGVVLGAPELGTFTIAPQGTAAPEPPPPAPAGTVKYERWMYPADVRTMIEGGAMASGWQRAVWLPEGSSYPVPTGWLAFYGHNLSYSGKLWIVCPEVFVNPKNKLSLSSVTSAVVQGALARWDMFRTGTGGPNPGSPLGDILLLDNGTYGPMRLGGGSKTTQYNYSSTQTTLSGGKIANNKVFDLTHGEIGGFYALEGCGTLDAPDGFQYQMEGFGYDNKGDNRDDTLVLNRCRLANHDTTQGNSWVSGGGSVHFQGDAFQPISGPDTLYVVDFVGVTSYQGFFLQMGTGHKKQYMRRVHLRGDRGTETRPGGQSSLFWDTSRADDLVDRDYGAGENGVFLNPNPGKTGNSVVYGGGGYADAAQLQIGEPPADFVPYAELAPWSAADPRWSTSYPQVG